MSHSSTFSITGKAGIGLRADHIDQLLELALNKESNAEQDIPWVELLVDNWLADGGLTQHYLDAISQHYPLTLHGVGLSLGGTEALNLNYLEKIKSTLQRTHALWYSEHLCFSQLGSYFSHDLLPLPYTDESVQHVVKRIEQVQDFLGCQLIIENVSTYLSYKESSLSEGEFISALAAESGCGLLLDVNNFYVNQVNHQINAFDEILKLPLDRIKEIHLAGFTDKGDYLIDSHNNPVADEVWALYEQTLQRTGNIPTLIEWDSDIPDLGVLLAERNKAQQFLDCCEEQQ